jgi:hypothetical protein
MPTVWLVSLVQDGSWSDDGDVGRTLGGQVSKAATANSRNSVWQRVTERTTTQPQREQRLRSASVLAFPSLFSSIPDYSTRETKASAPKQW